MWTATSIPAPTVGRHRSCPGLDNATSVAFAGRTCNEGGELMGVVEKAYVMLFLKLWSSFHPDLCQYVCCKEVEATK